MFDWKQYLPWIHKNSHKKVRLIIIVIVVIFVFAFIAFIFSPLSRNKVPSTFSNSRQSASAYAQTIVSTLDETTKNISDLGAGKLFTTRSAIADMVSAEIQRNQDVREISVKLALELEQMAKQIPNIYPESAAQTALIAISQETALIGRLLSYNNDLGQLFLLVQDGLVNNNWRYTEMNTLIKRINDGAQEVNDLNTRFTDEMQKFDAIYN
jgi:ABC-type bacteriocin/lantibiotic exporter with double-glycine peptidase domain